MVDPNRTINLPSSSEESEEEELDDDQIQLIKHLEEKFKDRFTDRDEEFMEICKRKKKDPPILELNNPFQKRPQNNYRGGYNRGGGGYQYNNRDRGGGYHNNRGGYNNYNNNNRRNYSNYSNNQNQKRRPDDYERRPDDYESSSSSNSKRPRFNQ